MNYYKCINDDYASFKKGQIVSEYAINSIHDKILTDYPEDWKLIKHIKPTYEEVVEALQSDDAKLRKSVLARLKAYTTKHDKFVSLLKENT